MITKRYQYKASVDSLSDVTADSWSQPTSQPDPRVSFWKKAAFAAAVIAGSVFATYPTSEATISTWQPVVGQPTQNQKYLSTANQNSVFQNLYVAPQSTSVAGSSPAYLRFRINKSYASRASSVFWNPSTPSSVTVLGTEALQPQSQPVQSKKSLITASQQAFFSPVLAQETITVDKWFQLASQPQPRKVSRDYLYFFYDVSTAPETTSADKWFQPTSQPYPSRKNLSTAEQQYLAYNTSTSPETVTIDKWQQLISQPVYKKGFHSSEQQFLSFNAESASTVFTVTYLQTNQLLQARKHLAANQQSFFWSTYTPPSVLGSEALQPQSQPLFKEYLFASNQQSVAFVPVVQEIINVDKWFQPVFQPIKVKQYLQTANQQFYFSDISTSPENIFVDKFGQLQNQPYFARQLNRALIPYLFYDPSFTAEDRWHQPVSQPTPGKSYLSAANQVYYTSVVTTIESIYADKWFQPTSQPIYRKSVLTANQQYLAYNTSTSPENVTEDRWHQLSSQPSPPKQFLTANQQSLANPVFVQELWFQPQSQPVLSKQYLQVTNQQSYFAPVLEQETITVDKWFQQVSQPIYKKIFLSSSQQAYFSDIVLSAPEIITIDKWFQPTSQPIYKKNLLTSEQQYLAYNTSTSPETVTVDKWFQLTSQPVYKQVVQAASQQYLSWNSYTPPPVLSGGSAPILLSFTSNKSFASRFESFFWAPSTPVTVTGVELIQSQSQPTPGKKYLAANQQAYFSPIIFTTEVITVDKWFQLPSQPVYQKSTLVANQQYYFSDIVFSIPEVINVDKWFQPVSQPVYKKQLLAGIQQYLAYNTSTVPETIYVDKWYQPPSQPYPSKKALQSSNQQTVASPIFVQEIITVEKWFQPVSQPVQTKKTLSVANQQSYTSNLQPIESIFEEKWHQPQSQPYPFKNYLQQQQAFFWNTSTQPEPVTEDRWHQSVSQPYPYRKFLHASQQQAFTSPIAPVIITNIPFFLGTGTVIPLQYVSGNSESGIQATGNVVTLVNVGSGVIGG